MQQTNAALTSQQLQLPTEAQNVLEQQQLQHFAQQQTIAAETERRIAAGIAAEVAKINLIY